MGKNWQQGPFPLGKLRFRGQQSIFVGSTCPQCWLRMLLRVWASIWLHEILDRLLGCSLKNVLWCSLSKTYRMHLRIVPRIRHRFLSWAQVWEANPVRIVWAVCTKEGRFQSVTRDLDIEKPWRKCLVFQQWPGAAAIRETRHEVLRNSKDFRNLVE